MVMSESNLVPMNCSKNLFQMATEEDALIVRTDDALTVRACTQCLVDKPLTSFYIRITCVGGRMFKCKTCYDAQLTPYLINEVFDCLENADLLLSFDEIDQDGLHVLSTIRNLDLWSDKSPMDVFVTLKNNGTRSVEVAVLNGHTYDRLTFGQFHRVVQHLAPLCRGGYIDQQEFLYQIRLNLFTE